MLDMRRLILSKSYLERKQLPTYAINAKLQLAFSEHSRTLARPSYCDKSRIALIKHHLQNGQLEESLTIYSTITPEEIPGLVLVVNENECYELAFEILTNPQNYTHLIGSPLRELADTFFLSFQIMKAIADEPILAKALSYDLLAYYGTLNRLFGDYLIESPQLISHMNAPAVIKLIGHNQNRIKTCLRILCDPMTLTYNTLRAEHWIGGMIDAIYSNFQEAQIIIDSSDKMIRYAIAHGSKLFEIANSQHQETPWLTNSISHLSLYEIKTSIAREKVYSEDERSPFLQSSQTKNEKKRCCLVL